MRGTRRVILITTGAYRNLVLLSCMYTLLICIHPWTFLIIHLRIIRLPRAIFLKIQSVVFQKASVSAHQVDPVRVSATKEVSMRCRMIFRDIRTRLDRIRLILLQERLRPADTIVIITPWVAISNAGDRILSGVFLDPRVTSLLHMIILISSETMEEGKEVHTAPSTRVVQENQITSEVWLDRGATSQIRTNLMAIRLVEALVDLMRIITIRFIHHRILFVTFLDPKATNPFLSITRTAIMEMMDPIVIPMPVIISIIDHRTLLVAYLDRSATKPIRMITSFGERNGALVVLQTIQWTRQIFGATFPERSAYKVLLLAKEIRLKIEEAAIMDKV